MDIEKGGKTSEEERAQERAKLLKSPFREPRRKFTTKAKRRKLKIGVSRNRTR